MKKENKIPKFYTHLIFFMAAIIIVSLIYLTLEKKLSCCFYVIIIEGSLFLVIMGSAVYSCLKMKLLISDQELVFFNNNKRLSIPIEEIKEIKVLSSGSVIFLVNDLKIPLSHSITDSSELLKQIYDSLIQKRADLMTEECRDRFNVIYKNSLCFDLFAFILEKVGFFATGMAILSFFVAMYVIVDHQAIKTIGQISYLLYALGWPFIAGLLLLLRFAQKIKTSSIENTETDIIRVFFHNYPYSLIFSTFAEIFIALSVLKFFY